MKIGDKIKFLNEVGGGTVAGFKDKNTVLVRDDDGFEIPVLVNECVVVDTVDPTYRPVPRGSKADKDTGRPDDAADRPVTFVPKPVERRGGDRVNVYLGFVAAGTGQLPPKAFEAYLVNDSNYYVAYTYAAAEGTGRRLRAEGTAEPNTKVFLEEFTHEALPEMERIAVQLAAFKRERVFQPKPAFDVELRLGGTKFYKPHTFGPTDFFEEPALLVDIVRDDRAVRSVFVDAESLREALAPRPKDEDSPARAPRPARKKPQGGEILEVDLHASELLETTAGMTGGDILEYQLGVFRRTMDEHRGEKGKRIVFIHGKGDGVLRKSILHELGIRYKNCTSQDASFREYGFGATMVTIH